MPNNETETRGRRISLDLTAAAASEVDKLKTLTGLTTAEIFRHAFSLLRIYVQARKNGQEIRIVDPRNNGAQTRLEFPIDIIPSLER